MSASPDSTTIRVTKLIRRDIISGALPAGTRLTEKLLSERYGVSRIPIRESLRALESEGLVDTRPFAGASVASVPDQDAEDLFAVRIVLEGATARRSAQRAMDQLHAGVPDTAWWEVRRDISEVLDQGDALIERGELGELAALNMRFHALVAQLSGSSSLQSLLRQISGRLEWLYAVNVTTRGQSAWGEHRDIMRAVDGGDAADAERRMQAHVAQSRDSYFAHVSSARAGQPASSAGRVPEAGSDVG